MGIVRCGNLRPTGVPVTTTLALTTNATQITPTHPLMVTATLTPAANSVTAPTGTVRNNRGQE